MKNPILQILIVTYNQSDFAEKIIRSVKSYACEEIQVMIQDDGSTDGSFEALHDALKNDEFVQVKNNEKNIGAVKNVSTLIEKATADYILNLGGDDFFFAGAAQKIVKALMNESPDLLIGLCFLAKRIEADHKFFGGPQDSRIEGVFKNADFVRMLLKNNESPKQQRALRLAAELPGLLWCQGVIFKTSLLKKTQLLKDSDVDDWGILHNLAVHEKTNDISISILEEPFSLVTSAENSRGSQILNQLERQLHAVINFWHDDHKKNALLNVLEKKIIQLRNSNHSAAEIIEALRRSVRSGSTR